MRYLGSSLALTLSVSACAAAVASATPCPNIMFVLDRSGSMAEPPNGGFSGTSKWQLLQAAVKQVVTMYGDQVPFGMEMFTSGGGDDASCYADTTIDVEPAHDTAPKIISLVTAAMPDSGTNTAQAIRRAAGDPSMHDAARGNFIVLITDGDPNCPYDDSTNAMYTVKEIQAAASAKINTFVIGFDGSGGVNPDNLNRMARAGMQPQPGCAGTPASPCYYSASNAQKFNDAINKIINQVVGGEFGMTMCDDSCNANGCPSGQVCTTSETNPKPHCEADPCAGAPACANGDYCRGGTCVHSCAAPCKTGQKCVDGNCVSDPCNGVTCSTSQVCNPLTGACVNNLCATKMCPTGTVCDPVTGACDEDQCRLITCPMGTTCQPGGNCEATSSTGTGGGGGGGHRAQAPGCSVAVGSDASGDGTGVALSLLALLGLALAARRKLL